jgi:hypothetical protein
MKHTSPNLTTANWYTYWFNLLVFTSLSDIFDQILMMPNVKYTTSDLDERKKMFPDTSIISTQLAQLVAREDFINLSHREPLMHEHKRDQLKKQTGMSGLLQKPIHGRI